MQPFTKEEALQNIHSMAELERVCDFLHDAEEIPFSVSDAKMMIGLIKHLAIAAGYIKEEE